MEQFGIVTEERGQYASVSLQRHLTCESCGRCGILSGAGKNELTVEALNPIQAHKGQRVLLENDDSQIIYISFMLYIIPLAALVTGIVLWLQISSFFNLAGRQELIAVAAGFIFMAIVFFFIRLWDQRIKDNPRYKPVITALIEGNQSDQDLIK